MDNSISITRIWIFKMRKLISFTLYGSDPKYVNGMFRNIELKEQFYPDWDIIIYHDDSLEQNVIERLSKDASLRNFTDSGIMAASWRFCAFDEPDVERFIVRDSDSRLSQREADAVLDWEKSDKELHIMRDHPHHGYPILGGMWGLKNNVSTVSMKSAIIQYQGGKKQHTTNRQNWSMTDMDFLRDCIYGPLTSEKTCKIHAAKDYMHKVGWHNEPWAEDFPTPRNKDKNFIGEIFSIVDGEEKRDYQYTEL